MHFLQVSIRHAELSSTRGYCPLRCGSGPGRLANWSKGFSCDVVSGRGSE